MLISLGYRDPFNRAPSVEVGDGKITFLPGRSMRHLLSPKEAPFPQGSWLEYRSQSGDMLYPGDHQQPLSQSLWVVSPDGTQTMLACDFVLYISPKNASEKLKKVGIGFHYVKSWTDEQGRPREREIEL